MTPRRAQDDRRAAAMRLRVLPLTRARWDDLVRLFGARGACGGCWCMWPRLSRADFERGKGEGNKRALRRLVDAGRVPGLIGYLGDEPVGWVAIEPRAQLPRLERSRVARRVDEEPVWSIVCLFVARAHRRRGFSAALADGAVRWARRAGARIVEAYAVEPREGAMPAAFAYPGLASAYRRAGFVEVARRTPTRPIMRRKTRGRSP